MKFSVAAIIACSAVSVVAHHGDHERLPPQSIIERHLMCPTAGGTATVSMPCPTKHAHRHKKEHHKQTEEHEWDGTVTVYPSDAPETTTIKGIHCKGKHGPSCSEVVFASRTCDTPTVPTEGRRGEHKYPTVTASDGATKTVHAQLTATCKPGDHHKEHHENHHEDHHHSSTVM